jgi:RNA polymerase sigma factor (sigma-70 family)
VFDTSASDALPGHRPRLSLPRRALCSAGDDRLVEQVRAGSARAFEEIYDRHHRGILAFCRHMLGSREEAEDAVQHTFIAAYQSLLADERQIALKAWLYTVARNRCLSLLRARHEHADIDGDGVMVPATAGLSAEVERREDLRALLADLQRLPEDQRAALVLAELEAHSHDEIAVILDVRPAKVKALVFQAREALMSRRHAREADCGEIREQLAVLRGGALRRSELRHHVADCAGCRAFAAEVKSQRAALAVLLPVVPSLALKHSTLTAAFAAGSSAAAAGGAAAGGAAVAGSAAAGGAAAGGTAAVTSGTAAAGGAAAGGTAVAGTAAAGGAAAGGGSALLTSGGALLGAKVIATKAVIAFALTTGVAGGGYMAVQQLPGVRSPAHSIQARTDQQQTSGGKLAASGGLVSGSHDECMKEPATAARACLDKESAKADGAGSAASDREDGCPNKPAATAKGCLEPADGQATPADHHSSGTSNSQDHCPTTSASIPSNCPDSTAGNPPLTAQSTPAGHGPNSQDSSTNTPASTPSKCPDSAAAEPPLTTQSTTTTPDNTATTPTTTTPEPASVEPTLTTQATPAAPDTTTTTTTNSDPGTAEPLLTAQSTPTDKDGDGIPNNKDTSPNTPAPTSECPAITPLSGAPSAP